MSEELPDPVLGVAELIEVLRSEGGLLADAAERAGLAAPVPSCPEWTVRDLLLHTGGVHRWATTIVAQARTEPIVLAQAHDIVDSLPADDELVGWFRAGHAELVDALAAAPDDLACYAFLPAPTPRWFWARRQAHETTMHRVDAEGAAGAALSPLDPAAATDGIDELVTRFGARRNPRLRADTERTLHLHATDTDTHWLVRIGADRPRPERVAAVADADTTAAGPASALYRVLWNRSPWSDLAVTGLPGMPELWAAGIRITWS